MLNNMLFQCTQIQHILIYVRKPQLLHEHTHLLRDMSPELSRATTSLPSRFMVVGEIPSSINLTLPIGNLQGRISTFHPCLECTRKFVELVCL